VLLSFGAILGETFVSTIVILEVLLILAFVLADGEPASKRNFV